MKDFRSEYIDEGMYNICDVVGNFSDYFGMSLEQMLELFQNYEMVSLGNVIFYVSHNLDKVFECRSGDCYSFNELLVRVKRDYEYLRKNLDILSKKGIQYLNLFQYLERVDCRQNKLENFYEAQLKEMGFFHYRSVLIGSDLKFILLAFFNTLKEFENRLHEINDLSTYHDVVIDSFAFYYGGEGMYPEEGIVLSSDIKWDRTSVLPKRTRKQLSIRRYGLG